jgi:hypothetical protein
MVLGHPSRSALSTPLITSSRISAHPTTRTHRWLGREGRERHDIEADDDEGGSELDSIECVVMMVMMSFIYSCRNKIGAELHIYLEEGTYHKRLFRGSSTNDMKK